ncbi:hypothetical protein EDC94DRAFT_579771 [Helicostylum pulchrum]|nr:hypothetical protein EDC94DRAFT_579771 [Helicostylum pulchrum]
MFEKRLKNLIDAMVVLGYQGHFTTTCEQTMNVLLGNKDALMSVFQTLGTCWSLEENLIHRIGRWYSRDSTKTKFSEKFELQPGQDADRKVKELIENASNHDNLAKMYAEWAPFV